MSTVLVTGAGGGIGAAIAERLCREGHAVGLLDLDADRVGDLTHRLQQAGARAIPLVADVTDERAVADAVESLVSVTGELDGLVNNAGGFRRAAPLEQTTPGEWDRTIATNLRGTFLCSRASLPHLCDSDQARIVNIASVAGRTAVAGASLPYAAAKAGLLGFTRSLAVELAPRGIAVNAVAPGLVGTERVLELHDGRLDRLLSEVPAGRLGRVEEIAAVVAFLLGPQAGYLVGATLDVNGGRVPV